MSTLTNIESISVLAAAPSNGSNSSSTSIDQTSAHMLVQNLTKTNVPVTLPLTRGYVNGFEVFYISTEASDKGLADHLTNFTHSRVSFAPALKNAPPQSLANIYVFRDGIKGSGPLGFQRNVADSQPGDPGYSPYVRVGDVVIVREGDIIPVDGVAKTTSGNMTTAPTKTDTFSANGIISSLVFVTRNPTHYQ